MNAHSQSYPLLSDVGWLRARHVDEGLTVGVIARRVGCSYAGARQALIRQGLYQPARRGGGILGGVDREQLLEDAGSVTSWLTLSRLYGTSRISVQDRALVLGVLDEVPQRFLERLPGWRAHRPPRNDLLCSRNWIVMTWAQQNYQMLQVARLAGCTRGTVLRWMDHHRMTLNELRDARNRAITIEYEQGWKIAELAVTYRLDPAAIFRILRRSGVDTSRNVRDQYRSY